MTLIKSISGIRGTIGGLPGDNLTPVDVVKFVSAYGAWIKQQNEDAGGFTIVVGRDARISGDMVSRLVSATLSAQGIHVVDIGLATTPTTEIAVTALRAKGGIILTASHNPKQWNALKLLNHKGEFLSARDGKEILEIAEAGLFEYADVDSLGTITQDNAFTTYHINKVIRLDLTDLEAIRKAKFRVVVDAVNSVGGIVIPKLLKELGVAEVIELYCTPDGQFPHNPEPLPEHLTEISKAVIEHKADLGFVVDPDVDRLAIVSEDGTMFGEEYTLVAVADYVLQHNPGNTVSNLSSSMALKDITLKYKGLYNAAAVGEVNVVAEMKRTGAVIGGEGNGGVIYPEAHYGRDALVGIALFLSHLARKQLKCSQLRQEYPNYFISKNKVELSPDIDVEKVLQELKLSYTQYDIIDIDGVKIHFENEWVHLRKSNTEPIIRIYAESSDREKADLLARKVMETIKKIAE